MSLRPLSLLSLLSTTKFLWKRFQIRGFQPRTKLNEIEKKRFEFNLKGISPLLSTSSDPYKKVFWISKKCFWRYFLLKKVHKIKNEDCCFLCQHNQFRNSGRLTEYYWFTSELRKYDLAFTFLNKTRILLTHFSTK